MKQTRVWGHNMRELFYGSKDSDALMLHESCMFLLTMQSRQLMQ